MHKTWFPTVAVAATAALLVSLTTPEQAPAQKRLAEAYADWLTPYIGKAFYLSPDATMATEKARTNAVPDGAEEVTLAGVGQDFAWFEGTSGHVCVPLVALRTAFKK